MEEAALKLELHEMIDHAENYQLAEIYELLSDYFKDQEHIGDWDTLSENQKAHILKGLEEAEAGLGTPAKDVIQRVREKYGLTC